MNRWQAHEVAANNARRVMRQMGLTVHAVAQVRQQEEGEFASLDKWEEERVLEFLTDPRNTTVEYSRETKTRIFVKFTEAVTATWPR
jgi:hypothetical protein